MLRWKAVLKVRVIGISNKAEEFVSLQGCHNWEKGGGEKKGWFMWKNLAQKTATDPGWYK